MGGRANAALLERRATTGNTDPFFPLGQGENARSSPTPGYIPLPGPNKLFSIIITQLGCFEQVADPAVDHRIVGGSTASVGFVTQKAVG